MQAALKQTTAVLAPDPFSAHRKTVSVPPGLTITQVVAHAAANDNLPPRWAMPYLRVFVGGVEIPKVWWPRTRLKDGQRVAIVCAPQGGRGGAGKVFRTILTVAVIALTAWVGAGGGAGLLAGLFSGVTFGAGTVASALAAAGVSIIGGVLTNALAPSSSSSNEAASQSFSLTGARNVAKPYQPMTAVLGKRRVVPPLAAATWTETVGDDVYLRMMVQWHIGPCSLSDIKIGETPIGSFEGVEMQHRLLPGDAYPTLYDTIVREEPLQVFLRHSDGWQQRTSQRETTRISIDFAWPTGLAEATDNNNEAASVELQVQYRAVGAGAWTNAPVGVGGVLTYTDNKSNPFRRSIDWDVAKGQYEVQIQRVTNDTAAMNVTDQVYWVSLRSYGEGRPFLLDTAAITALRIKSSAQLNGVLDTLNAVVQMHAPKWDSEAGAFGAAAPSRNPGEILNWLALGPANARPLVDRVDVAGLGAWAERCTAKNWNCDHIVDSGGTLDQVAQIVAGTGRGFGAMWFDGKLSVAVDDQQDTPVQEFSARNVRNFSGSIAFPGALHAVNVQFQDEENGYQTATRTIFAEGYSNDNATLYETIDAPGKTGGTEAYVVGWRYLNGRLLRPETYEFDTDLEGLVCRIGQRIQVAHYRMSVGISGARVKARVLNDGGEVTGLWLDETVTMVDGKEYVFRAQSGAAINLLEIETVDGTSRLISFPEPLAAEDAPRVGDHGIFGEAGRESLAAIVVGLGVKAGKDSHVVAIPYAPALLADGGDVPPWDPLITPRGTSPMPIGVHAPGLDRVVLDKVVKVLNDERGARVEGDAQPVDYARLSEDLQEAIDQVQINEDALAVIADAKQKSDASLRRIGTNLEKISRALLQVQMVVPQLEQTYQRQLAAYVEGITGTDVTDFAARLLKVETTMVDLEEGKASSSDLQALDAQINTPTSGLQAIVGQLQETVAALDPSSATATLIRSAAAIRLQGQKLSSLAGSVLNIQGIINDLQKNQSLTFAWFNEEITTTVTEGLSANARSIGELGVRVNGVQASVITEQQVRANADSANAQASTNILASLGVTNTNVSNLGSTVSGISSDVDDIFAALGSYTGAGSIAAAINSVDGASVSRDGALTTSINQYASYFGAGIDGTTTVKSLIDNEASTRSSAVGAVAANVSSLFAAYGDVSAGGFFSVQVQSTPSGADARIALLTRAASGGSTYDAAMFMDAMSSGLTRIMFKAAQTAFMDNSGNAVALFDAGGAHLAAGVFADNGILGPKVQLGELSKPYMFKLLSAVDTNNTASSQTEVLRGTVRALGGPIDIVGWLNAKRTGSGAYNNYIWQIYRTAVGASIFTGDKVDSAPFYMNDGGEIHRMFSAYITDGIFAYDDDFDVVLVVQNDAAANKPIQITNARMGVTSSR